MGVRYTTRDYLRDTNWFVDFAFTFWEENKPKFSKFYKNLLDFEYEEYIFRIADNLPYAMLILFLGFIGVFTLARYTERGNGVRISSVTTLSMNPEIPQGSLIITIPRYDYEKGEIVSYKELNALTGLETGRLITHRIIDAQKKEEGVLYTTKGDSNDNPDPNDIKKEQIFGEVSLVIPYLGYFDIILRTIPGFLIFIVIPSIILIRNEVSYIKDSGGDAKNLR